MDTNGVLDHTFSAPMSTPTSTATQIYGDFATDAYGVQQYTVMKRLQTLYASALTTTPSTPALPSALTGNTCDRATDPTFAAAIPCLVFGGLLCSLALLFALLSPRIIPEIYCGKLWSTQAWLFGVRGVPDLRALERELFGFDFKRLQWSTNGSLLSGHERRGGECRPKAPVRFSQSAAHPDPRYPVDVDGKEEKGMELYTIIDTFTMTATAFYAERPPSAAMVCGHEGGMLRVVMCSYDWKARTFVREAVVRTRTPALERMGRVDRFRFALGRRQEGEY